MMSQKPIYNMLKCLKGLYNQATYSF